MKIMSAGAKRKIKQSLSGDEYVLLPSVITAEGVLLFELNIRQLYDKISKRVYGGVKMGAMLIGMVTGGIAMACFVAITIVYAAIIFIDAYRHKMKAVIWTVMALLFNFWSLPVYIIVRIKIANLKCTSCGTKVGSKKLFCPECGTQVKRIDDGTIAKKVILYVVAAFAIISVLGGLYVTIITELDISIPI